MEKFTYGDYIRSIHTVRLHSMMSFMEDEVVYKREEKEKNYGEMLEETAVKEMMSDKEQVCLLLTRNIQFDFEVSKDTLESCNMKIPKRLGSKNPDFIFKIKNKEIYILIEIRENKKSKMHYRMLNYCIELMQKILKEKTNINLRTNPKIIPIVIQRKEINIDEKDNVIKTSDEYLNNKKEFMYNIINI